jgi:hypothetical protein
MFNLHKTSINNIPNSDKKDPLNREHVCSFGAYLLHLGNVGKRVSRRFLGLQLFHVKPYEASEAEINIFISISEPIKVGHEVSKHNRGQKAKKCLHFFIC